MKKKTVSEFYYIEFDNDEQFSSKSIQERMAIGPFLSEKELKDHLIENCEESFLDADSSLRELNGEDWAAPVKIVEVKRAVRQSPVARVEVSLKNVKI